MIRKRRFLISLGLFISLFSICTGYQVPDQCTWSQHLRVPGRTAYTPCDGPETSEILWEIPNKGDLNIPPLVIGDTVVVLVKVLPGFEGPRDCYSSLLEIDLMTGEIKTILRETGEYIDFFYDGSYYYVVGERDYEENIDEILRFDSDRESLVPMASISGLRKSSPHCHAIILEDVILYPTTPLLCFSRPDFEVLWSTESILPNPETTIIYSVVAGKSNAFISVIEEIRKEEEIQYSYHLYNLDITTGKIIWHHPIFGAYTALEEGTLFAGGGGAFYALDAATGQILWKNEVEAISSLNIVVGPEYLFAAYYKDEGSESDYQHTVIALDKKTGRVVWKRELGPLALSIFLVGGGKYLYCATSFFSIRSDVVCFDAKTGEKVWDCTFGDETHIKEVRTFPALANGVLVVPTHWGPIYAFSTNPDSEDAGITDEPEVTPPPSKPESTPSTAPESSPPDTQPPTEPPSQTPPASTEPEPLQFPKWYLVVAAGVIIVLITYVLQEKK